MFGLFKSKTRSESTPAKSGGGCCGGSHVHREEGREPSQGGRENGLPANTQKELPAKPATVTQAASSH